MATVIHCDGCGQPAPDGVTSVGTLRVVDYCALCLAIWRQHEVVVDTARRECVERFAEVRRQAIALTQTHLQGLPDA